MAGKRLVHADADISGRAVQFEDFSPQGQKTVSSQINSLGRNARSNVTKRIAATAVRMADPTLSAESRKSAAKENTNLKDVKPHIVNKGVTLDSAATNRVEAYHKNISESAARGNSTPDGAGWYFNHSRDITNSANKNGFDPKRAMTASAVMSPQNSPDNEKASVGAIMTAMSTHKVHYDQHLHDTLTAAGIPSNPHHVGRMVGFSELHPDTLSGMTGTKIREHVKTGADLQQIARGGTKENISKAVRILSGEVHPDDAINPHTAPKVWSYNHNITTSDHGSAEHGEYMMRVQHHAAVTAGDVHHGQQMFDHFGLRGSTSGQLSSQGHTAEDTWQNTLTHGQAAKTVGRTAVNKTLASNISTGYIADSGAHHAFNNKATRMAAEQMSVHGYAHPSTSAQEVPWTQVRRDVGKDPEFNQTQSIAPIPSVVSDHVTNTRAANRAVTIRNGEKPVRVVNKSSKQLKLWG